MQSKLGLIVDILEVDLMDVYGECVFADEKINVESDPEFGMVE